jgi:hypothetical protein
VAVIQNASLPTRHAVTTLDCLQDTIEEAQLASPA